ncbi:hypothetical protein POSPLADRAFT_1063410 [Postia placenta MAD-698-R-SB12]|uniref:Uncharacterized protein n=1 Tax=Postia placenta MAD-698-R-SB12 TaxID=670580 RepID=A0A1X6MHN0_9APHY|nr:hypothetical protein POSPLADRAFT_1063410 [Postia placenta MAD-698-R-SB12]OSX55858.1 hypothetical protein POSPLADRAFT_1063410 [Postia placenta MAD-698-R-SB12]
MVKSLAPDALCSVTDARGLLACPPTAFLTDVALVIPPVSASTLLSPPEHAVRAREGRDSMMARANSTLRAYSDSCAPPGQRVRRRRAHALASYSPRHSAASRDSENECMSGQASVTNAARHTPPVRRAPSRICLAYDVHRRATATLCEARQMHSSFLASLIVTPSPPRRIVRRPLLLSMPSSQPHDKYIIHAATLPIYSHVIMPAPRARHGRQQAAYRRERSRAIPASSLAHTSQPATHAPRRHTGRAQNTMRGTADRAARAAHTAGKGVLPDKASHGSLEDGVVSASCVDGQEPTCGIPRHADPACALPVKAGRPVGVT